VASLPVDKYANVLCRKEFLRDSDQLAARMTGVVKLCGAETFFESFFFAEVDRESGKLKSLIERAVWGEIEKKEV
jgi:hypothetical protein